MLTNQKLIRETAYRGEAALEKLAASHVTIAGVGTLGSQLAETLARQGFQQLRLIDMDRVEPHNLGHQAFGMEDVGALKVDAMRHSIFRAVEIEIEAFNKELNEKNIDKLLRGTRLVIDAFDNHESRLLLRDFCRDNGVPCLHAGLFEGYGEVVWNGVYKVPTDAPVDICDYPLARNLAMIVVAIAAEETVNFLSADIPRLESWCVTLGDLKVSPYY